MTVRFLITGSSGLIGADLSMRLRALGCSTVGIDLVPGKWTDFVTSRIEDVPPPVEATVLHFGAGTACATASEAEVGPDVPLAERVLKWSVGHASMVILASSDWVEREPWRPYAAAKRRIERLAAQYDLVGGTVVAVERVHGGYSPTTHAGRAHPRQTSGEMLAERCYWRAVQTAETFAARRALVPNP